MVLIVYWYNMKLFRCLSVVIIIGLNGCNQAKPEMEVIPIQRSIEKSKPPIRHPIQKPLKKPIKQAIQQPLEAPKPFLPLAPLAPAKPNEHWYLFGKNGINILPAWELTRGSKNVNIAVIDSGFSPDHPAFSEGKCPPKARLVEIAQGERQDADHGTGVSSLIQSCEGNPLELIGINQVSPILWLERGKGNVGIGSELIQWGIGDTTICAQAKYISCPEGSPNPNPAHIVNLSIGRSSIEETAYVDRKILLPLVAQVNSKRKILVAAAGNDGKNADLEFPASATGVISVGYTDANGKAAPNSNWGRTVEIMAPGKGIPIAGDEGKDMANGSSFATPIVSGIISLMRSVYPALNWKTAVYFLQSTAVPMDCHAYCIAGRTAEQQNACQKDCCVGDKQICTLGRVDAGAAVLAAYKASLNGLPSVPLVDSDKYWVSLKINENYTQWEGTFTLFNVGASKGNYKITGPDGTLTLNGKEKIVIQLAAKGQVGDSVIITVTHPHKPLEFNWKEAPIHIVNIDRDPTDHVPDRMTIYTGMDF